mmetsp:Transcript_115300/g.229774  ORF Transcript_115300/g.229774 Transcript_115300/m.229774 type:complete len:666 (+) Transcript_115300:176-2173(+)
MLGRKAILHTARAGKRKWQLEQEKADDDLDDSSESDGATGCADPGDTGGEGGDGSRGDEGEDDEGGEDIRIPNVQKSDSERCVDESRACSVNSDHEDEEKYIDEDEVDGGNSKKRRFAWMDSGDEASEGEDEDAGRHLANGGNGMLGGVTVAATNSTDVAANADAPPFPPLPPPNLQGPAPVGPPPQTLSALRIPMSMQAPLLPTSTRHGLLRPPLRPPLVLPPGTQLPILTQEHLELMSQISITRTVDDLWDLIDKHWEDFAAAHAATSLYRLSVLHTMPNGSSPEQRVEKSSAFTKLSDRVDELLATPEGRSSFLPADLAMVVSALAKVVTVPTKEGAVGRIFADIADEAETRICNSPESFTPPMLGDLAWGVSRSGGDPSAGPMKPVSPATRRFFEAIIQVATPKLAEMTCQDLANLAAAYAEATREDADGLLQGVFNQAEQRLSYQPPPTNALFSTAGVPGQPATSTQPQLSVAKPVSVPPTQLSVAKPVNVPPPPTVPTASLVGTATTSATSTVSVLANASVAIGTAMPVMDGAITGALSAKSSATPGERPPSWQQNGQWKFTGAQISEIAMAVSKHINLYEPRLFDLVAKQFVQRLQEFTTDQLRRLRDAFDTVRHDRDFEFLRSMKMVLKQREVRRSCKAFRGGSCKFGDRCVYSHDE